MRAFIVVCCYALLSKSLVCFETYLSELFCLLEELLSAVWIHLVEGCETNLTLEEVLELAPVWLLAVESEWVLVCALESWVVSVEVPVTALDSELLLLLAETHASLETVVDTWSVSDDE